MLRQAPSPRATEEKRPIAAEVPYSHAVRYAGRRNHFDAAAAAAWRFLLATVPYYSVRRYFVLVPAGHGCSGFARGEGGQRQKVDGVAGPQLPDAAA